MTPDWRTTLYLPGLLEKAIHVRAKEFYYRSLSPFFTELVCFDLRKRVEHTLTGSIALDPAPLRDATDREIIQFYVPGAPRNFSLLNRLTKQLFGAPDQGSAGLPAIIPPPINPKTWPPDGPASPFASKVRFPKRLRSIIEIRWQELNYESVSEYVTGLVRYDLILGGPHTYFNGHDRQRYLLDALDVETETTFHARTRRQRILLDYMIEEAAGGPLTDEERHAAMVAIAQKLRENAAARGRGVAGV